MNNWIGKLFWRLRYVLFLKRLTGFPIFLCWDMSLAGLNNAADHWRVEDPKDSADRVFTYYCQGPGEKQCEKRQ